MSAEPWVFPQVIQQTNYFVQLYASPIFWNDHPRSAGEDAEKKDTFTMLVGMQTGSTTMESWVEDP